MCGELNIIRYVFAFKFLASYLSNIKHRLFESHKCDEKMLAAPNPVNYNQRRPFTSNDTIEFTMNNVSREVGLFNI